VCIVCGNFWLMYLNRCVVYKQKKVITTCCEEGGSRDKNRLRCTWHAFGYTGFHGQMPGLISTWVSYNFNLYKGCQDIFTKVLKYLFECLCWMCYDRQIRVWECSIGERFLVIVTVNKLINSGNLWPLYMMCLWYIMLL
jgi:hypothetical protein